VCRGLFTQEIVNRWEMVIGEGGSEAWQEREKEGRGKGRWSVSHQMLHVSLISITTLQVELIGKSTKNHPNHGRRYRTVTPPHWHCAFGLRTLPEITLGICVTNHAVIQACRNGPRVCGARRALIYRAQSSRAGLH
jgi:hypothetical protein